MDKSKTDKITYLRRVNYTLFTIWCLLTLILLVSGVSPFGDTIPWMYVFLQIVTLGITALIATIVRRGSRIFALSIVVSLVVMFCLALGGFYSHSTIAPTNSNDYSGTMVRSRSIGTADDDALVYPAPFIASYFGYNCDGSGLTGNCSTTAYVLGILVVDTILSGGVVVGNILARRHILGMSDDSVTTDG